MHYLDITRIETIDKRALNFIKKKVESIYESNQTCCIVTDQPAWIPTKSPYILTTRESLMMEKLRDDSITAGDITETELEVLTAGDITETDTDVDFLTSKEPIEEPIQKPAVEPVVSKLVIDSNSIPELMIQQMKAYSVSIPNNLPMTLTPEQYTACLFFTLFDSVKSFLLNHGTGVGKTVEGSFIAHTFLNLSTSARVIILILGVTRSQWETQLRTNDVLNNHMDRIDIVAYDTTTFGNRLNIARSKLKSKDRVLVIIDEIHIMVSRCVPKLNEGERPMLAYLNTILELTRRGTNKLLVMSATPFTNSIKEFELYLNILRPSIFKSVSPMDVLGGEVLRRVGDLTDLLKYSVSSINPQTAFAFSNTEASDDYAAKRIIFKRVVMHSYQMDLYRVAEEIERKTSASGFRFMTRNYGNFAYKVPPREGLSLEEYNLKRSNIMQEFLSIMRSSSQADKERLMEQCSMEFKDIVDHISSEAKAGLGMKCVIYINMMENIDAMKAYLEARDITYFEFSGRTQNVRQDSIKVFNSTENLRGDKLRVMILSSAGSIGINIYAVRRLYFLSQEWTNALSQQIIGRCLRYRYHVDFPPDERVLQVFLYFSVLDKDVSTDESIFDLMKRKYNILSQALSIMIESSIESKLPNAADALKVPTNELPDLEKLGYINTHLDQKANASLSKLTFRQEKVVRNILYRYSNESAINQGYLKDGWVCSENLTELADENSYQVLIENSRLIYVIARE